MKELKELKFEELTTEQKLGIAMVANINTLDNESAPYTLELIKKRCVGAVWVNPTPGKYEEVIAKVKEAADYPILIMCDAESGIGDYKIGRHNALGCTGSDELAYTFGKITGVTARKMGYNIVCNPILDLADGNNQCGMNCRSMGNDKEKVAKLAAAEVQGMHDGGVLAVGKHYPGMARIPQVDTHMAEGCATDTEQELLDYNLYPYKYLIDRGLLDGVMTTHSKFVNIDPDYPASLSKKVISIIREKLGFEGFCVTDALSMMGVVAKYGKTESKGLAIEQGNDLALTWCDNREGYAALLECYEKGIISDEALDAAVKRVLATQHKVFEMQPKYDEITDDDLEGLASINKDSIFAKTDDGVSVSIPGDSKNFFVVLSPNELATNNEGTLDVDPNYNGWYNPANIVKKIEEMFPNSTSFVISEFPTASQNSRVLDRAFGYDNVIFITFFNSAACIGEERFTPRIISLINAMQVSDRISTVMHFGNPYVLEDLSHIPRVIIGTTSKESLDSAFDVLAGNYPAKGVLTYDIKLK
ncbi:MAG: hypothetical protein E7583_07805 [Ruminococcaceae bacterium]|nr:hypothetical protein [Oscillospiraceae bacterium]